MQLGFKPHPLVFYLHLNTDTDVKMSLHAINTPTGRLWLHPHWSLAEVLCFFQPVFCCCE